MSFPLHRPGLTMTAFTYCAKTRRPDSGFSLVELAIAIFVMGLLLGGLIVPLSAQIEQRRILTTQKQLEEIKSALMGFAAAHRRLPCPATNASNGTEAFQNPGGSPANGFCATFTNGLLPAATLGLAPVDAQGFALDAWNARIRYAVSLGFPPAATANAFTRTDGMKDAGINAIVGANDLFRVCAAAGNALNCGVAPPAVTLSRTTVVVIYSLGGNAADANGSGPDELENLDDDPVFVSHPRTATSGNEFDDLVTWIGPNLLINRMIESGQLP